MKTFKLFSPLVIFLASILISCDTSIPDVDNVPPTFAFTLNGPGINKTYTQETDFSVIQLNLKANSNYHFTFTGNDEGGVQEIEWLIPFHDEFMSFLNVTPEDAVHRAYIDPIASGLALVGSEDDPRSILIMSGSLNTGPPHGGLLWHLRVKDYGGAEGRSNLVFKEVSLFVVREDIGEISLYD